MGEMNTKEAGLAILAGIRVLDAATEEEDPDMEMLLLCMPQAYQPRGGSESCYLGESTAGSNE